MLLTFIPNLVTAAAAAAISSYDEQASTVTAGAATGDGFLRFAAAPPGATVPIEHLFSASDAIVVAGDILVQTVRLRSDGDLGDGLKFSFFHDGAHHYVAASVATLPDGTLRAHATYTVPAEVTTVRAFDLAGFAASGWSTVDIAEVGLYRGAANYRAVLPVPLRPSTRTDTPRQVSAYLSDGTPCHYRRGATDQVNWELTLKLTASQTAELLSYHAAHLRGVRNTTIWIDHTGEARTVRCTAATLDPEPLGAGRTRLTLPLVQEVAR